MLGLGTAGIIDARLPRPLAPTLYARFGDWSAVVLILFAWAVAGFRLRIPHLGPFGRTSE
jgi:apolipoprotein N-acyltransferase